MNTGITEKERISVRIERDYGEDDEMNGCRKCP